jgi:hypothetical protein
MAIMAKRTGYPVNERALLVRINRRLASEGQQLHSAPRGVAREELGRFYLVGDDKVLRRDLDLEAFAREIGVLKPWEQVR